MPAEIMRGTAGILGHMSVSAGSGLYPLARWPLCSSGPTSSRPIAPIFIQGAGANAGFPLWDCRLAEICMGEVGDAWPALITESVAEKVRTA